MILTFSRSPSLPCTPACQGLHMGEERKGFHAQSREREAGRHVGPCRRAGPPPPTRGMLAPLSASYRPSILQIFVCSIPLALFVSYGIGANDVSGRVP